MITKALQPGDQVLVRTYETEAGTLTVRAPRGIGAEARTVKVVQRNAGPVGSKNTNRVFFTDGTSTLTSATDDWIMA